MVVSVSIDDVIVVVRTFCLLLLFVAETRHTMRLCVASAEVCVYVAPVAMEGDPLERQPKWKINW